MIRASHEVNTFETDHGAAEISLYDILWVEGSYEGRERPTRLHLANRVVTCRKPLEELLPVLGDEFLFCLTNGAVNQLRIRSFGEKKIVLDGGEELALTPFLAERFREKYCSDLARRVWED